MKRVGGPDQSKIRWGHGDSVEADHNTGGLGNGRLRSSGVYQGFAFTSDKTFDVFDVTLKVVVETVLRNVNNCLTKRKS